MTYAMLELKLKINIFLIQICLFEIRLKFTINEKTIERLNISKKSF